MHKQILRVDFHRTTTAFQEGNDSVLPVLYFYVTQNPVIHSYGISSTVITDSYRILLVLCAVLNNVRFKKNRGALQTECVLP